MKIEKRCQVTNLNLDGRIIASHLWPRRHARQLQATIPGITQGIEFARNGLFLAEPIECAFDHLEVCFIPDSLNGRLVLKVLRKDTNSKRRIMPVGGPCASFGTVLNWNNKPLNLAGGKPSMKTLSLHASCALERAKDLKWITQSEYDAWIPLAQFHSPPQKSASDMLAWVQSSNTPGAALFGEDPNIVCAR